MTQCGGTPVCPVGHLAGGHELVVLQDGTWQLGGVPTSPLGQVGVVQLGGVPTSPVGHVAGWQLGGVPVSPCGQVFVTVTVDILLEVLLEVSVATAVTVYVPLDTVVVSQFSEYVFGAERVPGPRSVPLLS